jgi:hypothetical protein
MSPDPQQTKGETQVPIGTQKLELIGNLKDTPEVNPAKEFKNSVKKLPPLSAAGVSLSTYVLCIISGFILHHFHMHEFA